MKLNSLILTERDETKTRYFAPMIADKSTPVKLWGL